jgi:hypothetical protein
MRTRLWISVAVALGLGLSACGGSSGSSGPSQAAVVAACTHLCQCETATTDTSCHDNCASAPAGAPNASASWTSVEQSFSSWGSSLSSDPFNVADQACIDCFTTASCAAIMASTACVTECQ